MTTERRAGRRARGAPGAKAVVTTASVAATLAAWAWLADEAHHRGGGADPASDTAVPPTSDAALSLPAAAATSTRPGAEAPARVPRAVRKAPAARTRSSR